MTPNLESLGKLLLIGGAILAAAGLIALIVSRLGLGRLPGDIFIQRENVTFYFPLATMLIVSIILTIIINLFRR
ncbi:MAG: DUF2905 domain-containing protein [Firmicutes bacterium]|nr:DUF2905 domain-containing protein [Bacillota bacterium]